jgi:dihydroorotase
MVVVTTTGQFVAIRGPCIARNNDASILNHLLKCNINDIKGLVKDHVWCLPIEAKFFLYTRIYGR